MHSRNPLVFFVLFFLLLPLTSPQSTTFSFNFPSFTLRNLTLLGDSYLRNGVVGLTRATPVPYSSSGTLIYNRPILFSDQETNTTLITFSTRFSFSITNINPTLSGDGLSFFLSPNNVSLGSPGGYLGLVNSSQLTKNKFIAIEFDTKLDSHFNDPNDNHVGLDIDTLKSIKTANAISTNVILKSGNLITAWIDYSNKFKRLKVFLSYSVFKPESPLLVVDVNLNDYLKDFKYVGFSASTEGSTEIHSVENWSFMVQTLGFDAKRGRIKPSRIHPHNVSDNSVINRLPVDKSEFGNWDHKRFDLGVEILGPGLFCAILVLVGWVLIRKGRNRREVRRLKSELMTGPREFSYKELKLATKGFHSSRIIGHGAFGTVYKAFLNDSGSISAVKRSKRSHEGKTEFLAELSTIACLRHKNLVQLQGWCVEKGELVLVYEFMPNGSLDKVLHQESEQGEKNNSDPLKWAHRYNIAVGLASVLTYLHQECEQQVIHRDVKTSNIMLDANFNARLGDFGLARLMDHDKSPVSTLTAGTMGYLAPEYLQYGKATEKTDVYSYGVVVLEMACGRRPIEKKIEGGSKMLNLVDWVWELYSQGRVVEAADKNLNGEFEERDMKKLLLVGLSCANPDDSERPSMRRVLQILENEAENVVVPKMKPALTFSSLPMSLENIFSDGEQESIIEIRVE